MFQIGGLIMHDSKMLHDIINCMIEFHSSCGCDHQQMLYEYENIEKTLGKQAANTLKSAYTQHFDEYLKKKLRNGHQL